MFRPAALVARRTILTRPLTVPFSAQPQISRTRLHSTHQKSPTGQFYSAFTRPVAKCLLLALFTYQVIYWGWVKLEQDEFKQDRDTEIAKLEAQVQVLQEEASKVKEVKEGEKHGEPQQRRWWWPF